MPTKPLQQRSPRKVKSFKKVQSKTAEPADDEEDSSQDEDEVAPAPKAVPKVRGWMWLVVQVGGRDGEW